MLRQTLHLPKPRLLRSLREYRPEDFAADLLSGVTVGLIALPLALALGVASIPAGIETPLSPPAMGLFTAILAGFIISALGGSRVQIGGPTAAFIPIVLMIVEKEGIDGLLLATSMAGVILVLLGVFKLGTLIKFIPFPVVSGFTTGIAVAIMLSQAPDLLGIVAPEPAPREFAERILWLIRHLHLASPATVIVSVLCLFAIVLWSRFGLRRIPGSILMLLASAVVVAFLGLDARFGIQTVAGRFPEGVPSGLPPFRMPEISLERIQDLLGPATAIALLGAIESLLSAVVADGLTNERHDSNTELVAQGLANIVCPFFCGLPATGAIARTTANISSGARSPVSGMVHAVTLLLVVLLFSNQAKHVPMAGMAAVLVLVAYRMGEWRELANLGRMPRSDALVLVTTFALTVVFDLVVAVQVGLVLASILFIRRVSETTEVSRVTGSDELEIPEQLMHGREVPPGVVVYRIFGPFLFGAAEKMEEVVASIQRPPRVLILRLQLVPAMDLTALGTLENLEERMRSSGGQLVLSGVHRQPLEVMRRAGFVDRIGRENLLPNFDQALARARILAGKESRA